MSSFSLLSPSVQPAAHAADRRIAGLAATVLVHAALILGWQMARTPAPPSEETSDLMQWVRLPPMPIPTPVPAPRPAAVPAVPPERAREAARPAPGQSARPRPAAPAAPAPAAPASEPAPAAETPAVPRATAADIMESARRSVGSIDRALRKESKPTIIAPPDSPQIRMREGMEQAHALAPPRLWEAPKVEELVNNTGDGARRTRVITGNRTYCITSRSPATNVEMIEMHGREMITSCPKHETPARKQVWRTARD